MTTTTDRPAPPAPGTPEWARLVTASKVAAILGVSPWDSPRSMWHKMRGDVETAVSTDATRRGHYLEAGVLAWWEDQHPEFGGDIETQVWCTRPELPWAAATPDLIAHTSLDDEFDRPVIVDAKTSSSTDEWGTPGTDEVPLHYLVSSYWQLAMAPAARRVYIALLGPFLRFEEYVIDRPDESVLDDLIARCKAFHDSLAGDEPPPLDDTVATFQVLRAQRGRIEKKATAYVAPDLASQWVDARATEDAAVAAARLWDCRLIEAIGNAQYAHTETGRFARQQDNRNRPIPLVTTLNEEPAA